MWTYLHRKQVVDRVPDLFSSKWTHFSVSDLPSCRRRGPFYSRAPTLYSLVLTSCSLVVSNLGYGLCVTCDLACVRHVRLRLSISFFNKMQEAESKSKNASLRYRMCSKCRRGCSACPRSRCLVTKTASKDGRVRACVSHPKQHLTRTNPQVAQMPVSG